MSVDLSDLKHEATAISKDIQKEKNASRSIAPLTLKFANTIKVYEQLEKCYRELTIGQKIPFVIKTTLSVFNEIFTSKKPREKAKIIWAHSNAELDYFLDNIKPLLKDEKNLKARAAYYFLKHDPNTGKESALTSDKIRNHRVHKENIRNTDTLNTAVLRMAGEIQ